MYHFVKLENNTWYLKPESEQDVLDHFKKVMGREFELGFEDRKEGTHIIKGINDPPKPEVFLNHPSTPWRIAVEPESDIKGQSWLMAAIGLEAQTLQDRLRLQKEGRTIYLSNNLTYFAPNDKNPMQVVDEVWKEELVYPYKYDFDKAVCTQNKDGKWEVYIDDTQVRDKRGKTAWSIKAYAMEMAREFCNKY